MSQGRRIVICFSAAFLGTAVGSLLLAAFFRIPDDLPILSRIVGWSCAVLLSPGSFFLMWFPHSGFFFSNFWPTMALGFLFNVLAWAPILYGSARLLANLRSRFAGA